MMIFRDYSSWISFNKSKDFQNQKFTCALYHNNNYRMQYVGMFRIFFLSNTCIRKYFRENYKQ